jgi:hypothetical protein
MMANHRLAATVCRHVGILLPWGAVSIPSVTRVLSPGFLVRKMRVLLDRTSQGNKTLLDRVQITRLDESIPRWQVRDLKVSTSQLRYALRASEEQIQEAVNLKPGQQMLIDIYLGGV